MASPGQIFETEVKLSMPSDVGGLPVACTKIPDPSARSPNCRKCKAPMVRRCANGHEDNSPTTFTAKPPFDFLVVVGGKALAIECKETKAQAQVRDPFAARLGWGKGGKLKPHQVAGLAKIAAGGGTAGVLWLIQFEPFNHEADTRAELFWLPIQLILALQADKSRRGVSVSRKEVSGWALPWLPLRVDRDFGRGTTRRYWHLSELLRVAL